MKKRISGIISVIAILSTVLIGTLPAAAEDTAKGPDNEVLELKSVFNPGASLNHTYYLNAFTLPADYVPQEGDALEYDVKTNVEAAGVGGIDVAPVEDGAPGLSPIRDTSGATDEDGTRAHPAEDISAFAYDQWYSRKILFPETYFGTTIPLKVLLSFDMTECKPYVGKEIYALYDNIRITRGGETLYMLFEDSSDPVVTDSFLMDTFLGNIFAQTTVKVIKESEAGPMITSGESETPTEPAETEPAPTKGNTTTKPTTANTDTTATQAGDSDSSGNSAWIWIVVIGAVVIIAVVVAVIVVKKKKAQS